MLSKREWLSKIQIFWALCLFFPLVIPNALRSTTVPAFLAIGATTFYFSFKMVGKQAALIYFLHASVSIIYLLIGTARGGVDALEWVAFVYLLAPLFWLVIWFKILRIFDVQKIINVILFHGFLGALSVLAFYYVFQNYGAQSLSWLIAEPNMQADENRTAATMHVYGSLIFIAGGLFAAPTVVRTAYLRLALLILFAVVALLSGRVALVVALLVGVIIYLINIKFSELKNLLKIVIYAAIAIVFFMLTLELVGDHFIATGNIDSLLIITNAVDKILQGGGDERIFQSRALIEGIYESYFAGAGHGIGVSVVRNEEQPWKYELLWLSTLFHVGVLGFIVYSIPLLLVIKSYILLKGSGKCKKEDTFIFSGFIAIAVASITNPYIESFDFQWMVVFPCVYFYCRFKQKILYAN